MGCGCGNLRNELKDAAKKKEPKRMVIAAINGVNVFLGVKKYDASMVKSTSTKKGNNSNAT